MSSINTRKPSAEKNIYLSDYIKKNYVENILSGLDTNELESAIKNRSIYLDINIKKVIKNGKEEFILFIESRSGIAEGVEIYNDNIDVFIDFCKIHGFFPNLNTIYIDGIDILSKLKELEQLLIFGLKNDGEAMWWSYSEIFKIVESMEALFEDDNSFNYGLLEVNSLFVLFRRLFKEVPREVAEILGSNLKKHNNVGTYSENVFIENFLKVSGSIREKLGIFSTYMKLSNLKEDQQEKIDFRWFLKLTPEKDYKSIPIQFTTSKLYGEEENVKYPANGNSKIGDKGKLLDVEKHLFNHKKTTIKRSLNIDKQEQPFILLFLNSKFKELVNSGELEESYYKWVNNNDCIRERQDNLSFPFFIDTLNQKYFSGAEIINFLLHIIMKKGDFNDVSVKYKRMNDRGNVLQKKVVKYLESSFKNIEKIKLGSTHIYLDKINFSLRSDVLERDGVLLNRYLFYVYYKNDLLGNIALYNR